MAYILAEKNLPLKIKEKKVLPEGTPSGLEYFIPVFAKGAEANLFHGIYENNEIYHKMMKAIANHH